VKGRRVEDAFPLPARQGEGGAVCSPGRRSHPAWLTVWIAIVAGLMVAFVVGRQQAQAAMPVSACDLHFSNGTVLQGVPVAETIEQQARGLSRLDDPGAGMLFTWANYEPRVFWMRDTNIPLSVGFFDKDGLLFAISDMEPNTDTYHFSVLPAADALELGAGDFGRQGLNVGVRLVGRECQSIAE